MKKSMFFIFLMLLIVACGSNKIVKSEFPDNYPAKFSQITVKHDAVLITPQTINEIKTKLAALLSEKYLMDENDPNGLTISIDIVRYEVYYAGHAFSDLIESEVLVVQNGGKPLGAASVTTYNQSGIEPDYGFIGMHVRAILDVIN